MVRAKRRERVARTVAIRCAMAVFSLVGATGWGAKIVYPWRATTAIAKTGSTVEVWFQADSGQTVNSVQLKGPYNTVNATVSQVSGSWVYDPVSGNSYNRKLTVTVPANAPAERYDLVVKTSTGDVTSLGAVKVVKDYKAEYYVVHFSDVHRWQNGYDVTNNLRKVSEILKLASLIDAQMVFETGDNVYTFNRAGRDAMVFEGIPSLGIIGHSKTTAATFIAAGNHDTLLNNYELDANPQACATYWNTYYGLPNHNFKYGNGRFVIVNNTQDLASGMYDYQRTGAISWLTSGAGAGGNFVMLAAHWNNWYTTIDNARSISLGIYGHSHESTGNPRALNGANKGFIAPDLRSSKFTCLLFKVNNNTGAWTPVSGSGAYVNMLNSGNPSTPSTWVLNLTQSYSAANNGTLTNNTATFTNRFGFAVSGAKVRFVMKRGSYKVSVGTIHQQFDGTLSGANVTVVDVNVDVPANGTKSVTVSPQTVSQVTVPNVMNLTEAAAKSSITGAGLTVSGVSSNYHATVAAGLIYSQTPGGGTLVAPGSSVALAVSKGPSNLPPYFTSNPFAKPDATVGVAYNEPFSGKAVDPEGGAMTFSKVSGPVWMSVTPNGNATGTPGSVDVGTNSFQVKVTDNAGLSATATMTIKVNAPTNPPQTVTFTSIAAEDGYVNESGETTNIGGTLNSTNSAGAGLRLGDMNDKKQVKTIVSFDTSSIPDGAVIQSATLKLMRGAISGTVTNLGQIKVDIKGGTGFNNATALSKEDFQAAADAAGVATMSYPSANGTLSTGVLSATGLTKVNKTGKTQMKVYFATDDDNDTTSDYIGFYPAENATVANRPVLVITYQ